MRLELCFRPVVRPDRPPDGFENRVGQDPAQAAHRAAEPFAPTDRLKRGVERYPTREIDEDAPATRLERLMRQFQDLERPRVRIERVDVDHLIERADPARVADG